MSNDFSLYFIADTWHIHHFFCRTWIGACSTDLFALTSDIDYKPNSFPPLLPDVFGKLEVCSVCESLHSAGVVSVLFGSLICSLLPLSLLSCLRASVGFLSLIKLEVRSHVRQADSLKLRVLVNISFGEECRGRLRTDCALLVSWQSFHALRLWNRTSGGGQSGLRRMDDPRGTLRAGLPCAAPGTAGSALHHEQTVGKTLKLK